MELYQVIHPRNITGFSYRYGDPKMAVILLSIQVVDRDRELEIIFEELSKKGMTGLDASKNELAKSHARYLIGGRIKVEDERIFRFAFPERPGSMYHFLKGLSCQEHTFNVTLFHYRNYGGDIAKVLVGMQVGKNQEEKFMLFMSRVGFTAVEETGNPVYLLGLVD